MNQNHENSVEFKGNFFKDNKIDIKSLDKII